MSIVYFAVAVTDHAPHPPIPFENQVLTLSVASLLLAEHNVKVVHSSSIQEGSFYTFREGASQFQDESRSSAFQKFTLPKAYVEAINGRQVSYS